jgi:PX domain
MGSAVKMTSTQKTSARKKARRRSGSARKVSGAGDKDFEAMLDAVDVMAPSADVPVEKEEVVEVKKAEEKAEEVTAAPRIAAAARSRRDSDSAAPYLSPLRGKMRVTVPSAKRRAEAAEAVHVRRQIASRRNVHALLVEFDSPDPVFKRARKLPGGPSASREDDEEQVGEKVEEKGGERVEEKVEEEGKVVEEVMKVEEVVEKVQESALEEEREEESSRISEAAFFSPTRVMFAVGTALQQEREKAQGVEGTPMSVGSAKTRSEEVGRLRSAALSEVRERRALELGEPSFSVTVSGTRSRGAGWERFTEYVVETVVRWIPADCDDVCESRVRVARRYREFDALRAKIAGASDESSLHAQSVLFPPKAWFATHDAVVADRKAAFQLWLRALVHHDGLLHPACGGAASQALAVFLGLTGQEIA